MILPSAVCRHEGDVAVAAVRIPTGCVAFPDDRAQFLCWQHLGSVWDGTDGDFELTMVLDGLGWEVDE